MARHVFQAFPGGFISRRCICVAGTQLPVVGYEKVKSGFNSAHSRFINIAVCCDRQAVDGVIRGHIDDHVVHLHIVIGGGQSDLFVEQELVGPDLPGKGFFRLQIRIGNTIQGVHVDRGSVCLER